MAQRRKQALAKKRSRSPRQTAESLRRALSRERALRKQALARENEALEQQAATSEILRVISNSPSDLQPVFDTIVRNFRALCGAAFAGVFTFDGKLVHNAGGLGFGPEQDRVRKAKYPVRVDDPSVISARTIMARAPVHIYDLLTDPNYDPKRAATLGHRRITGMPLLRDGVPLGAIVASWAEPGATPKRQEELLKTFADQAVIAIENVRLFNETKEALEQRTATAEILGVISGTPTDTQPVFEAIVRRATKLCESSYANVFRYDGERLHWVSSDGWPPHLLSALQSSYPRRPDRSRAAGRVILDKQPVHVEDTHSDPDYDRDLVSRLRYRRMLGVPLLRHGDVVGAITVGWADPGPIDRRHEEVLKTFAAQAVIAIENVRLFNETKEALEQQTAISEILRVISDSPTDVQPVLDAVAARAARICDATDARIFLVDGQSLRHAAGFGDVPIVVKLGETMPLNRGTAVGRAAIDRSPIHVDDMQAESPHEYPVSHELALQTGWRTVLAVPLLREGRSLGAITLRRMEVRPFGDKQITLLKTFADQAAIAIENARLFNETKEALKRQTATADILKVISSSPTTTQPVFESIVQKCHALYQDSRVALLLIDDGRLITRASTNDAFEPVPIDRESGLGACVLEARTIHLPDLEAAAEQYPRLRQLGLKHGYRSGMFAPLLREGRAIGGISVLRRQSGAFSDKDVALLTTFADQAVIAIENVRLFNETKEALERQTATAEVLKVIARSPSDVQPVFDALLENAVRLCGAKTGLVFRRDGSLMRIVAVHGASQGFVDYVREHGVPVDRNTVTGRTAVEGRTIHILDVTQDPEYSYGGQSIEKYRTTLGVPLVRDGEVIGVFTLWRHHVEAFTPRELSLVETFANQAVIAIENVRLFEELQERTEALTSSVGQLTALGEVGQAISSTLDLETVLKTIVQRAVQLAGLDGGSIYEFDERDEGFHLRAAEHAEEGILAVSRKSPIRLGEGAVGRAGATREPVVVEDVLDESYQSRVRELLIRSGSRAVLAVPLLREDLLLGALAVSRKAPGPFAPEVIELLKTFATQSAVAIQNARLFNETKQALEQQKATAEVLGVISGSIADTQPVFEKILDSCERLFEGHLVGITVVRPDGMIDRAAYRGPHEEEIRNMFPMPLSRDSASGNAILDAKVVHYPDIEAPGVPAGAVQRFRMAGTRAIICAPMLFEGQGVGAIWVGRNFAAAFTDKHIALLRTFADQAAIAIQNAKLFREIQEKSKLLEVASQHKSQFLASMSHELRTPLNAILGFSEMMVDGLCGEVPAGFKDPLDEMQKSGKHLLRLINNVLDLAKIEAGRMELALGDYSVHDTVESVRSTLRPLAAEKGLQFLANVPADIPLAYGDAGRITQCLMNLAGNSLKFTKEGRVEISVQQQNGQLRYCVADTGIGIPLEKIGSLFTEFKQTDPTIASEYGGTGLGLSITKKFIEMHGGRIWVESEIGKGSAFTFEIPLKLGK